MTNTTELYSFKDFDMEDFISRYLYELSPHEVIDASTLSCYEPAKMKITEAKLGASKRSIIENKCRFIQDRIIRRAYTHKENKPFSLSSSLLQKVIGHEYKLMLTILIEMGYLQLGNGGKKDGDDFFYYRFGEHSMTYSIPIGQETEKVSIINFTIKKYIDKTNEELKKYQVSQTDEVSKRYGSEFCTNYIKSLNKFTILNVDEFDNLIECTEDEKQSVYLQFIKDSFLHEKQIYSIDKSGRLYHALSNLRTDLKKYINIDFEIDCKNSNPLLLNYFIFNYKGIGYLDSYKISSILYILNKNASNPFHNIGKNLRNLLINNGIENEILAKLTDDELRYIYLTTTGQLWDGLMEQHPQYMRSDIKEAMFQEVFFSRTSTTTNKPFAADFKVSFPSVYKFITLWKKPFENDFIRGYLVDNHLCSDMDDKTTFKAYSSLSIAMMYLESQIFTSALKRMYKKRWSAVNIHDCIVVPKTKNKNQPTVDDVRQIMDDVYAEFGLKATFG